MTQHRHSDTGMRAVVGPECGGRPRAPEAGWRGLLLAALPGGGHGLSILELGADRREAPERLPHEDRSFDIVCGMNVLGLSDDPAAAAAEITRVARRRIVLLERNGLSVARRVALLRGAWGRRAPHLPWRVLRWFPRREFDWIGVRPVAESDTPGMGDRRLKAAVAWQSPWMMIVGQRRAAWHVLRPVPALAARRAARKAS